MQTTTEDVWETFHVPLQQFIRRRVSDETAAEDLLQDVFLDITTRSSSMSADPEVALIATHKEGTTQRTNLQLTENDLHRSRSR